MIDFEICSPIEYKWTAIIPDEPLDLKRGYIYEFIDSNFRRFLIVGNGKTCPFTKNTWGNDFPTAYRPWNGVVTNV